MTGTNGSQSIISHPLACWRSRTVLRRGIDKCQMNWQLHLRLLAREWPRSDYVSSMSSNKDEVGGGCALEFCILRRWICFWIEVELDTWMNLSTRVFYFLCFVSNSDCSCPFGHVISFYFMFFRVRFEKFEKHKSQWVPKWFK